LRNEAVNGGGIGIGYFSDPDIIKSCIVKNTALNNGGGIGLLDNPGGLICHCTVTQNYAYGIGGGVATNNSNPEIINTILWADSAGTSDHEISLISGAISVTYSDIQGGWYGTGNIDADPMFVDPAVHDLHLLQGSPCIDTGCPTYPLDPDSTRCDMGAFYFDQATSIDEHAQLSSRYELFQNYPNPFNATTTIKYFLPKADIVDVNVYDILGRKIKTLSSGYKVAGYHTVKWGAKDQSSGVYFYDIRTSEYSQYRKMLLVK
jgi:hypothetical protein